MLQDENKILAREVTPPSVYFNRRYFIRTGIVAASAMATGAVYRQLNHVSNTAVKTAQIEGLAKATNAPADSGFTVNEPETSFENITHYNNFYEFSTDKQAVADASQNFKTHGWQVTVGGLVNKPRAFDLDDILKIAPPEERVYRMRCVEGWSMVVP